MQPTKSTTREQNDVDARRQMLDARCQMLDARCQMLIDLGHDAITTDVERTLREALTDAHWRVRSAAARTLARVGMSAHLGDDTIQALLDVAYTDDIPWSWHAATWTLCELARQRVPIDVAIDAHPPAEWNVTALELCVRLPPETVAANPLLAALAHRDWQIRAAAATALGAQIRGEERESVAEALAALFQDSDPSVRAAAAKGLGQMGGTRAIQSLLALSADRDPTVQAMRLRALGDAIRAQSPPDLGLEPVRQALDDALSSKHGRVRQAATVLTARLGRHARPLMPRLIDALGDTDRAIADSMRYALVDVTRGDADAGPQLWAAIEHQRASVRVRALDLVSQVAPTFPNQHIRTERVTQVLLSGLPRSSYTSASWLLQQIPLDHAPTLEVIRDSLASSSERTRWRALALLHRSARAASAFVPALRHALHDSSSRVRLQAVQLLPILGRDAQPALPEFVRRAFEAEGSIARAARTGLEQLCQDTAFPALLADWFVSMGLTTDASEFLDVRLRRDALPDAVHRQLVQAARGHAAWHGRVADIRAQKYQRDHAAPPVPDVTAPLEEQIAHAVAMACFRATIKIPSRRTNTEIRQYATRREYAWHIGRLIELCNRHASGAEPHEP